MIQTAKLKDARQWLNDNPELKKAWDKYKGKKIRFTSETYERTLIGKVIGYDRGDLILLLDKEYEPHTGWFATTLSDSCDYIFGQYKRSLKEDSKLTYVLMIDIDDAEVIE